MTTPKKKSNYDHFLQCYHGQTLVKMHALSKIGVWEVHGEDPNCDLGGSHHEPLLGTFSGRLEDVIQMAVELPGFWQWGRGGRITPAAKAVAVNRVARVETKERLATQLTNEREELLERVAKLEAELAVIKKML